MVGLPTKIFDADVGVVLNFVIMQADGVTAQDLNGCVLTLYVENLTGSPLSPIVIDDESTGRCHYTITAGQLPYGTYRAQLRLFFTTDQDFRSEIFILNASQALS